MERLGEQQHRQPQDRQHPKSHRQVLQRPAAAAEDRECFRADRDPPGGERRDRERAAGDPMVATTDCELVAVEAGDHEHVEAGSSGLAGWSTAMMREEPVSEPKPDGKPFAISKRLVWEAWRRVKANEGAEGVDEESIQAFEENLRGTSTRSGIGCPRGATSRRQ
jgi:hypothetical protein